MDDLSALANWAGPLLARLSPAAQKQLARKIATSLRQAQAKRMAAQKDPDGQAWQARKNTQRRPVQAGRIKAQAHNNTHKGPKQGPLFAKLRQASHLQTKVADGNAEVGFSRADSRIANVHHYGLRDKVNTHGPEHQYAVRRLIGIADDDRKMVEDLLLEHLKT
jgi:phage virion morphogenesis protein